MLNPAQLSGIIAGALFLCAAGQLVIADNQVAHTELPSLLAGEEPVSNITVALEPIFNFEQYYINDINPFVPFLKRESERKRMWKRRHHSDKPTEKVPEDERPTPVPQRPVVLPELVLPTYNAQAETAPQIIGSMEMGDKYVVFVRLGDQEQQMRAGDKIGDWTLIKMKHGLVSFTDPDGEILHVGAVSTASANTITGTADTGNQASKNGKDLPFNPSDPVLQNMIEVLKNSPSQDQVRELLSNPRTQKLIRDPKVQQMLRDNGLGYLLD